MAIASGNSITATDLGRGLSSDEPTIDGNANFSNSIGNTYYFTERFHAEDYNFIGTSVERNVLFSDDVATSGADRSFIVIRDDDSFPILTALVVSPNPVNIPISSGSKQVTYSLFASDVGQGLSGNPTIDGNGSYVANTTSPYQFTETFNASDYGFSNSPITRTVTFTDGAGNDSTKSVTFNVKKVDDVAPTVGTLTISQNPVIIQLTPVTHKDVTYTVVASDTGLGLSGNPTINGNAEYVEKSGNTYTFRERFRYADYGFTNTGLSRTVTFTDSATPANSTSRTVSFNVRKEDNQAPTITSFTRFPSSFTLSPDNTSEFVTFIVVASDGDGVGFNDDDVDVVGATFYNRSGNTWVFRKDY